MKVGYLDLPSGISGDMFLGCLIDAGWPIDALRQTLRKLNLPAQDWSVEARDVHKGPAPLRAKLVDVKVAEGVGAVRHRFLLNPSGNDASSHAHRNLDDIRKIINASTLDELIKRRSIAVFTRLGNAEAKVHGTRVEHIHFHEVGALDAIVDIVGSIAGIHELGIEMLFASALPAGHGWADSQHGLLPLPAPATLEILASANAPIRKAPGPGELVTPTGAALICELATFEQPLMRLEKVAVGAGSRETEWPNVARLWIGDSDSESAPLNSSIVQIETNIDDMNPQHYGPLCETLFAAGALDVWLTPIQMKKGRPGVLLGVLLEDSVRQRVIDVILRETTTLGVRMTRVERAEAAREIVSIQTEHGTIRAKLKRWNGQVLGAMPEFEDLRRLAAEHRVPIGHAQQIASRAIAGYLERLR